MNQIDELRQIIVGDNSERLSDLKTRIESLDERTRDVAEVLAPAIDKGIKDNDDLLNALKAPVAEGLKQAIRAEPKEYAEILYPAIAPSIRLAISQALSSLLVTINQTVKSATSVSELGTRFQSIRTGVPYAELALRKSLLFRVEHLYLIDRDSGLLIAECASDTGTTLDSDAVSAMFSAIQSFVQDSFSGGDGDRLTDFKVGAYTVWIAHGPKAMLACIIMGDAPETLKTKLYDCLDRIRTTYATQIANFDGDTSGFEFVEREMEPLLQMRLRVGNEEDTGVPSDAEPNATSSFFLFVLFALTLYLLVHWSDKHFKLATAKHYLSATPGMLVTSIYWQDDQIVVEGLKDPDAQLPQASLRANEIEVDNLLIRTTPFRSLAPAMELRRFGNELPPPNGVEMVASNDKIRIAGQAPINWLLEHDDRLRQLSADKRLDINGLSASESSVILYLNAKYTARQTQLKRHLADSILGKPWISVQPSSLVQIVSSSPAE